MDGVVAAKAEPLRRDCRPRGQKPFVYADGDQLFVKSLELGERICVGLLVDAAVS